MKEFIISLEKHWSEKGFLYELRYRNFDRKLGEDFLKFIQKIDISKSRVLGKRFVELIWMIPLFLEWRLEDFEKNQILKDEEFKQLKWFCGEITSEIQRILGHP